MKDNRSPVLFHGTGILQLAGILASGIVEASEPDDYDNSGITGVSLTCSVEIARKFAAEAKDRDWENLWGSPVNDGVVIAFDSDMLEADSSLTAVAWDGSSAESEFRTSGHIYAPLTKITRIELDPAAVSWWIAKLIEQDESDLVAALQNLPSHLIGSMIEEHENAEERSETMGPKL